MSPGFVSITNIQSDVYTKWTYKIKITQVENKTKTDAMLITKIKVKTADQIDLKVENVETKYTHIYTHFIRIKETHLRKNRNRLAARNLSHNSVTLI